MSGGTAALEPTNASVAGRLSHHWNIVLGGGMIVLAALAAYHNSFTAPFLFDDHSSIEHNPTIRHWWPIRKALSPSPTSLVGGRPTVNLSLALNYALGGTGAWGYHAFNLAVHVLAGLTLYGIVRRTLVQPGLRERFGASAEWVAPAVALIWTVHPLQTEAVTYISQRCESLMGLFYLLTLYAFIRGTESRRSAGWFIVSVAVCFLGMASKEVMATAPVMVLLYDRTFVSGTFREAWTRHHRLYLGLTSSWLLLGWLMAGLHNPGVGYGSESTWWGYALMECRAVVHYLRLALWPHPLIFDYGVYVPTRHLAAMVPYALILALLATGVLFELKQHPAIGFVGAWFFVILAPTSSVMPIGGSPMAEHRMYLPLAAVVTLTVVGAGAFGKRRLNRPQGVLLGCVAGGSVAVLFTVLTIHRNQDYGSEMTIWKDTVEKRPDNPRAQSNLGTVLLQAGKVPEAIGHLVQALRIQPDYADAHYNLGLALVQLGKVPEAIGQYDQALRINPDYADAHNDLGIALERMGKTTEAITQYEQALRIRPDFADAHDNLGIALTRLGRVPEAIDHWEQALRINPNDADTHYNLALALMGQGRLPEAIDQYDQALRIQPGYVEAHFNLGLALEKLGRTPEAIEQYQQALKLRPDFGPAKEALTQLGAGP
jgi:tetratricopeptide (TPR) repeat protein